MGFIKEKIYDYNEDPEDILNRMLAMSPSEL